MLFVSYDIRHIYFLTNIDVRYIRVASREVSLSRGANLGHSGPKNNRSVKTSCFRLNIYMAKHRYMLLLQTDRFFFYLRTFCSLAIMDRRIEISS